MSHDFWTGKRVLITGATGFFGGWLIRSLLQRGANVTAIVRTTKPESQFCEQGYDKRVRIERGSVYDAAFFSGVIESTHPDVFFHAACGADVARVLEEPVECYRTTVQSTWNALETLRTRPSLSNCITILSSSDKVYGVQDLPYVEEKPLRPMHPYEVAKASADLIAQSYGKIYKLPVAITRCGNYFGPYDLSWARLIPGVMRSIANNEAPVLRSDGRFTRDYLHVEDAAEAHLLLAEKLNRKPELAGEAFNFSYGEAVEVIDIVRRLIAQSGKPLEPIVNANARAEIREMLLDSSKAKRVLGWQPRLGFEEGLRNTADWYLRHFASSEEEHAAAFSH